MAAPAAEPGHLDFRVQLREAVPSRLFLVQLWELSAEEFAEEEMGCDGNADKMRSADI